MILPSSLAPTFFDEHYRLDAAAWMPAVLEVCAAHGIAASALASFEDGSNLVAAVGSTSS